MAVFCRTVLFFYIIVFVYSISGTKVTNWFYHKNRNYTILRNEDGTPVRESWESARLLCENENAILFSPTAELNSLLSELISSLSSLWIGANDRCKEGTWLWTDGTPVDESDMSWKSGEPNNNNIENCVEVQNSGLWNDLHCSLNRGVVCQKCSNDTITDYVQCSGQRIPWEDCSIDCRPGPADILFIIDTSTSANTALNKAITFMSEMVQNLSFGSENFQVAVITYNFEPVVLFNFTSYTSAASLKSAFETIRGERGATLTAKALSKADDVFGDKTTGSRIASYKFAILITDGLSTDRNDAYIAAKALREQRIKVISIGIGDSVSYEELVNLAYSDQFVFNYARLDDVYNRLLKETIDQSCSDCTLNTETDIIILLDTNVNQEDFTETRHAVRYIIENTVNYNHDVRLGVMSYSDHPEFVFNLAWSNSVDDLIAKTFQVETNRLFTVSNITLALDVIGEIGFSSSNGGRPTSRKIVILLSTGNFNNSDSDIIRTHVLMLHDNSIEVVGVAAGKDINIDNISKIMYDPSQVLHIPSNTKSTPLDSLKMVKAITSYVTCLDDIFTIHA